jgi:peptidoglycan/LPS O-acetylase OafA/YrhL
MRRFEIGPLIVAVGSLVLLVSLFLNWYGNFTAWGIFEITDVLLTALALTALVAALGLLAPELAWLDRRWLLISVFGSAVLVIAAILSPPPGGADLTIKSGAWIGFAAVLVMLAGAVLSLGRVSFSVAVEGREPRQRVSAVDHRQPTTENDAVAASDVTEPTVVAEEEAPKPRRKG